MTWEKSSISRELVRLHKAGADLSYNALSRSRQSLVSAAAYHFGSYRKAVLHAGIDYVAIVRRPKWTRQQIISLIKSAKRRGEELHWSAVTRRKDDLGRAAYASLQPRLFGKWERALHAAGLDADDVAIYRRWSKASIAWELKQIARDGQNANSGAIQRSDPGLHAAAVRHFGDFDKALRAAHLDPEHVRQRKQWTNKTVVAAIKQRAREKKSVSDSEVRRHAPALYGAAVRLFGSFIGARNSARVKFVGRKKRAPLKSGG